MQLSPKQENIRVIIRLRPPSEEDFSKTCIKIEANTSNTLRIESQQEAKFFTSDYLADENVSQQEMYSIVAKPIVDSCIQGYNCCILAYGQTGSGKTHTMIGPSSEESLGSQEKGLIFRALEHLFEAINANPNANTQFLLKISFLEIYNEQIIDLLNQTSRNLLLREDLRKGVYVECLSEETPSSPAEAFEILKKGARNRHIGATAMNFESSRSHSVFSITLESRTMNNGLTSLRSSRFNFVDLAGSERQKHDIQQERFKEGCNINKSLHVLGKVINSLSESTDRKTRYIPYRDSKLTFLLKDSLGGNSKCTLIANINPNSLFFNESVSTLKFAQRAKMIKNDVLINEEASGNIECLKLEIRRLKEQILRQNLMESQLNYGQLNVPLNGQSNLPLNAPLNTASSGQSSVPVNVQLANLTKVNAGIIEIEKTMKSYLEQSVECEGGMRLEIERMREEIERAREGLEKAEKNEIQMRLVLGLMQERLKRKGDEPEYGELIQKETQILLKLLNTPLLTRIFKENLILRETTNKTDLTKLLKNSIENQLNLANLLGQEVENRRKIADHLTGIKVHTSDKENKELLEKLDLCNQELNEFKIKDSENMAICENMALQIQTLEEELADCRSQLIKQNSEFSSGKHIQDLNFQISNLQTQNQDISAKIKQISSLNYIKEVNMNNIFETNMASFEKTGFLQNNKINVPSLISLEGARTDQAFGENTDVLDKIKENCLEIERFSLKSHLFEVLGGQSGSEKCEFNYLNSAKNEDILGFNAKLKKQEEELEFLTILISTKEEKWKVLDKEKDDKINDLNDKNEIVIRNLNELKEELTKKEIDRVQLNERIKEMEVTSINERNRSEEMSFNIKGVLAEKIEELVHYEVAFKQLSDEYSELLEKFEKKKNLEAKKDEETELLIKQLNEKLIISNENEAKSLIEAKNLIEKIVCHENTIENLTDDLNQYKNSNEALSTQIKNSSEQIFSLNNNIETLEKTINLKENQIKLLESQFLEGNGKIEGVLEENERLIGINEQLSKENDNIKNELAEEKNKFDQVKEEISVLNQELQLKSSELEEVKKGFEKLVEEKDSLSEENREIKLRYGEIEIHLNEINGLYATRQVEIEDMKEKLDKKSNKIQELNVQLAEMTEEKEILLTKSNENKYLKEQMNVLLEEKQNYLQLNSNEISSLHDKINILLAEKEVLLLEHNQIKQENLQKQSELSQITANHLIQSENESIILSNLKEQLQHLSNENTLLNQKHLQTLTTYESTSQILKQDILYLNQLCQEKTEEISQLNSLLSDNQQKYDKQAVESQVQISCLMKKLEESEKKLWQLENCAKDLRIEQDNQINYLKQNIVGLNVLLSESQQINSKLSIESQAKITSLSEKLEESDRLRDLLCESEQKNSVLSLESQTKIASLTEKFEESQKAVLLLKNEADRLKLEQEKEVSQFERRIWELESEKVQKDLIIEELNRNNQIKLDEVSILFDELKEKHDHLKAELDRKVRETIDFSNRHEDCMKELNSFRNSQTQREEERTVLKRNLCTMEESYENLQKEISKLKATYKEKLNELVFVKESKQKVDSESKEFENRLISVENERSELLRTVSELEAKLVELAERSENEVKALKTSLTDRNSEISIIKTTLTDKIAEISNLKLNLADKGSEVGSLRKELENFKKKSEEKISELLLLRKELDLIKKKAERELEEEKLHFEEVINQKEFQLDEIHRNKENKTQELTQEIDKLKKIINNLKKQNEQFEKDSFETTRKLSDDHLKKNVKLLKENEKLKEDLKSLHLELQHKDDTLLSEKIKDFQKKEEARFSEKLSEKLVDLKKKEDMLKNLHETAKEYCRNQEVELSAIRKDYSLLEEEKRVLSEQLGTALGEKEKGRKENQVLAEKINRMNSDKYLLLKEIEVLNKANEGVSEEKSRLLSKLKEENNKLKEEKKQLLDSLSLEAEKNRRNSRKSFQPNENNINNLSNLEEIQNELEKKNLMVRDYNDNLNRLTTLLNLNNPLKPRLLTTGIKHNIPNSNSFENIIKEVSNLISNVSDKDSKIKDKEREIDSKNLKFSLMEKEYILQKQRFALAQNNAKLKTFENNENDNSYRENMNNNRSISPIGVNKNRDEGKGKFKSSEKNYFVLYK